MWTIFSDFMIYVGLMSKTACSNTTDNFFPVTGPFRTPMSVISSQGGGDSTAPDAMSNSVISATFNDLQGFANLSKCKFWQESFAAAAVVRSIRNGHVSSNTRFECKPLL